MIESKDPFGQFFFFLAPPQF